MTESVERPQDDAVVAIGDALAWQAGYCRQRGSDIAAAILDAVRDDLARGGAMTVLLPTHVRFGDLPGLRLMAAVHELALTRQAPAVALHLPTLGGTAPSSRRAFGDAVVAALIRHPAVVSDSLRRTPQTNETGRAALLRAALSRIPGPVRLREIGASAGLNLRADHLPGDPALESGPMPQVVDRLGCDLHPIDPTTTAGRIRLTSYVWVDDVVRFERLRQALEVAARIPATVVESDAADFVASLDLADGETVVWHSAMWVYLPVATRRSILQSLRALGARATATERLAHVSWEWRPDGGEVSAPFELVLRRWDGGDEVGQPRLIARGGSHGSPADLVSDLELADDPLDEPRTN